MKNVSSDFILKMEDSLRSYVPRMTINGVEVGGEVRDGMTINLGSLGTDNSLVGGVIFVPSFTATIFECDTNLQNKEIKLEIGLVLEDESIEYVDIGYFTVDKPNTSKYDTSFVAYGRLMSKMGGNYSSNLTYPASIQSIISEISAQCGYQVQLMGFTTEGTLQVQKPFGLVSYRDALGIIAGLIGGYVTEKSDGSFVVAKFSNTVSETLDVSRCYTYPTSQDEGWIATGIEVQVPVPIDDAEAEQPEPIVYTYGNPVNVSYVNQWMDATLFEAVKNNIYGFAYLPTEVQFLGDIRLEPWDSIKVVDGDEETIVPCMNIMHVWDGGLVTTITAPANTTAEDEGGFVGALSQQLDEFKAQVGRFSTVVADKVTAKVIESDEIKTEIATITEAEVKKADIDALQVKSINGKPIADGTILAKALSGAMVETIGGNKVYYQAEAPSGTDYKVEDTWYKTIIDPSDADQYVLHVWDGSQWVGTDFDGKVIRANTITAQEINTNSLATNSAFVNKLETELTRVGDPNGQHVAIDSDSVDIMDGNKVKASFGEKSIVGDSDGLSIVINPNRFELGYDANHPQGNMLHKMRLMEIQGNARSGYQHTIYASDIIEMGQSGGGTIWMTNRFPFHVLEIDHITDASNNLVTNWELIGDDSVQFNVKPTAPLKMYYTQVNASISTIGHLSAYDGIYAGDDSSIEGDLFVDGRVTASSFMVDGTTEPIGTYYGVSVASGTTVNTTIKSICSRELTKGRWIITARVLLSNTVTAAKSIQCNVHRNAGQNYYMQTTYVPSGQYLRCSFPGFFNITEEKETIHLNARVTTGSDTVSTDSGFYAIKVR